MHACHARACTARLHCHAHRLVTEQPKFALWPRFNSTNWQIGDESCSPLIIF